MDPAKKAARKARRKELKARLLTAIDDWRSEHKIDTDEAGDVATTVLEAVVVIAVALADDGQIDDDERPAVRKESREAIAAVFRALQD